MRFLITAVMASLLLLASADAEKPPVVLQTHLQPPYQVMNASQLAGRIPDTLKCIFTKLERPYAITVAPRKRNRALIKANRIDGFFLSIPDDNLHASSVPTNPLALERWKYFRLKTSPLPAVSKGDIVGAVLGSNEAVWLKQNGMSASDNIPTIHSLLKLLAKGRISFALADEEVFETAAAQVQLPSEEFESTFVKYVPLVAYFSKKFVDANPDFIQKFNASLNLCVNDIRASKPQEKDVLLKMATTILDRYEQSHFQHEPHRSGNSDVLSWEQEDKDWKEAVKTGTHTPLMKNILSNQLSKTLRTIAQEYPVITEIFITDENGLNIGMNEPTSDYWQGDEDAFKALSNGASRYISQISFDHSTHKFQIQISLPLKETGTENLAGMLTVGFDAEKALTSLGM